MFKKSLIFIFLLTVVLIFFLQNYHCKADITFPQSIEFYDFYEGGKLYINNENMNNLPPRFYFVKTSWVIDNETIYHWNGLEKNNTKGEYLENSYILDATIFQNQLFLLIKENNNLYVTTFDTTFSKIRMLLDSNYNSANIFSQNSKNIRWILNHFSDKLFLLVRNKLYEIFSNNSSNNSNKNNKIENLTFELISENASEFVLFSNLNKKSNNNIIFSYVEERTENSLIHFGDEQNNLQFIARLPIMDNISLVPLKNYLAVINSSNSQNNVLLNLIDLNTKGIVASEWMNFNTKFLDFERGANSIYALSNENNRYFLNKISFPKSDKNEHLNFVELPENLHSPLKLTIIDKLIYIVFANALVVCDFELNIVSFDFYDFNNFVDKEIFIKKYQENLIISASSGTLILKINSNSLWFVNRQISNTYKYAIPIILLTVISYLYKKYRNNKILLDTILNLPSSGFIFYIDKIGKLITANEGGKQILDISDNIPLKKQFVYYCKSEQTKTINELVARGIIGRLSFQQKINLVENNESREWFCTLIPLRYLTGRFRGVLLTGIDITEELEKQTLTNWAQLAHDMQTNLSIIRLNAEQIVAENDDEIRRKNKIVHQAAILMQRVKDIVTVGRDGKLEAVTVNSIDFCNEIRSEFDDNLFSKIHFELKLEDFIFNCDKPKLLRAVRNAIENGIKSMKEKGGTVTISCSKDIHNVTISIKDTGIGMDESTKNKVFTPFFSTAKESGHGIGTMIMQRVAELHGGKLIINSELGIGTEIIFQLPVRSRSWNQ